MTKTIKVDELGMKALGQVFKYVVLNKNMELACFVGPDPKAPNGAYHLQRRWWHFGKPSVLLPALEGEPFGLRARNGQDMVMGVCRDREPKVWINNGWWHIGEDYADKYKSMDDCFFCAVARWHIKHTLKTEELEVQPWFKDFL